MRFGIFIYDGVEPIDLATFGVLSMARRIAPQIEICTIAPRRGSSGCQTGSKSSRSSESKMRRPATLSS